MLQRLLCMASLALTATACVPAKTSTSKVVTCSGHDAGEIVITEFLANPEGTDTGKEYLELYNATDEDMNLQGFTLSVGKGDDSKPLTHLFKSWVVPARGYVSLGDSREGVVGPKVDYSYGNSVGSLPNEAGQIRILCGDLVIDEVRYTQSNSGKARILSGHQEPSSSANDAESNWCDAKDRFDEMNFGSLGQKNAWCPAAGKGLCVGLNGQSRNLLMPSPGKVVISEFLANPEGTESDREWLEVYAVEDVDLNGVEWVSGTSKTTLDADACLFVPAGSFAVLAKNANAQVNGGLEGVLTTFTNTLSNSASTLTLNFNGTLLDSVTYASTKEGFSTQLSASLLDAQKNDDAASFCLGQTAYGDGKNFGTPGKANVECAPTASANECFDTETQQVRSHRRPEPGDLIVTEFLANPQGADTGKEWFEVYAKKDVDLNELQLANEGTGKTLLHSTQCLSVRAGSYLLFASNADSSINGGLPVVPAATFSFSLANSGARGIRLLAADTAIDAITYGAGIDGGTSLLPIEGVSIQLDPASFDHLQNDDVRRFCHSSKSGANYQDGGVVHYGTPGAANVTCGP